MHHQDDLVLAVNAGSSSLKLGLYRAASGPALCTAEASGLEPGGTPRWRLAGQRATALPLAAGQSPFEAALAQVQQLVDLAGATRLRAVAHRIVHGGARCVAPCRLDAPTLAYLDSLAPLAPLHQPHNLAGVAAFARQWPHLPQVGCFDTAFHASLPAVEQALPLPAAVLAGGVRRYGFHGLSYQYLAQVLGQREPRFGTGRALLAHLGSGASLCGTRAGQSAATTMGFSALDGLMMGSRSGSLDPGVLLHLLGQGHDAASLQRLLYKQSGLLGVSGLAADMRTLRAAGTAPAQAAIALFTHRVVRESGAIAAALGGLDVIAFTGGIGEHDAQLRADVCQALAFLGVRLDEAANQAAVGDGVRQIAHADSLLPVWVVPTDEGRVAAQSAHQLLSGT